jgi:hypothetical protein
MRYGDDQCEECGAARVSGERLCAGCMVRMITKLENRIANKREDVEGLKKKIELSQGMLNDALNYGFKQNRENRRLLVRCRELEELITRRL